MDNGWIKIHRKLLEWEWYTYSEMVHLFIHLIVSANHKDKRWQGVDVKRGQIITSRKKLSVETGISEQTVRTCLERLQNSNEITIQPTNKYSIITICSYECYQEQSNESNQRTNQQLTNKNKPFSGLIADGVKNTKKINQPTNQQKNTANPTIADCYDNDVERANQQVNQQLTSNQPTTNQQLTTNKNDKNVKNEIKYTYSKFYDEQLAESENDLGYEQFIKILFGENSLFRPLNNVLKLEQVTFKQYERLVNKYGSVYSEFEKTLVSMENYKKITNNKTVTGTLDNWMGRRQADKPTEPKVTPMYR